MAKVYNYLMEIIKVTNKLEGSKKAFELFKNTYDAGANTFGLATGSTPEDLYKEIVASDLDFSDRISVNLDEYVGLSAENKQSYAYFMQEHLFNQKPFKESYLPNGMATDLNEEASRYDELVLKNEVDLQILGLGQNGHIGFNEPGTPFDSKTHVVDLTESTIHANSRYFDDASLVPKKAISMGIGTIMSAKKILLMAFGENKADAVYKMINGSVDESMPASILQNHPNVIVIVDEAAAELI